MDTCRAFYAFTFKGLAEPVKLPLGAGLNQIEGTHRDDHADLCRAWEGRQEFLRKGEWSRLQLPPSALFFSASGTTINLDELLAIQGPVSPPEKR